MSSNLRVSRRRRTHPRSGLTTVLALLGVTAMFIALTAAFTERPVSANTELAGAPPGLVTPVLNADFPPGDIAGRWTGTLTLTEVKAYQDITIPDLLDDTKPPTVLTKEQCEKQAGANLGKAQPITMDFQPQSPTSGQVQFGGGDSKPQIVPYQLSADRTTLSLIDNDALARQKGQVVARLQGQITVQGGNYVQAGPVEVTMGSEGITLLTMRGTWTVSKPAPPGASVSPSAPVATPAPAQKPSAEVPAKAVPPTAGQQPGSAPTSAASSVEAPGKAGDNAASGPFAGLPDFTKFIPSDIQKILKAPIPGMSGAGNIPGPKSLDEAVAGVLIPGLLGLGGLLVGGLFGGGGSAAPPLTPPESRAPSGPKRPEGDGERPRPPEKRVPTKEELAKRHEKTLNDIAKANKEAADANSLLGILKGTGSNAGNEIKDLGKNIVKGAKSVANDLLGAAKDINQDKSLITETLKGSVKTVADGLSAAADKAAAAGGALLKGAAHVWNNPKDALDKLEKGAKAIYDAVTDPQKLKEFLKTLTGYSNFENSMDPNRSLVDRLGQVGLGLANLYGTLTLGQAAGNLIKSGGSKLLGTEAATTAAGQTERVTAEAALKKAAAKEGVNSGELLAPRGGKTLVQAGSDVVVSTEGIPKSQLNKMQKLARESGYEIGVRPPAKEAGAMLESGVAAPKPPTVHNKSISEIDELIGAPKGKRGMVGSFEPELPPRGTVPKGMEQQVLDRFNERRAEFVKYNEYLKNMEKNGYKVIDGVINDVKSGVPKPLVSDIDLAGVFKNGRPIPEDEARMFIKKIMKECPGVTHPDVNSWYATGREAQEIMDGTIGKHLQGGTPLVVVGPEGKITGGFFQGTAQGPAGGGIRLPFNK